MGYIPTFSVFRSSAKVSGSLTKKLTINVKLEVNMKKVINITYVAAKTALLGRSERTRFHVGCAPSLTRFCR